MDKKIPFLNLSSQYKVIQNEIGKSLQSVLEKTAFASGPFVQKFEEEFAAFCGTKYCIGVNSGTSALHVALLAHGIQPGDEVITVPNTFIATTWAITYCNAKPVFVDVDPNTYLMNPDLIEQAITFDDSKREKINAFRLTVYSVTQLFYTMTSL